jgi:hypothetical protein
MAETRSAVKMADLDDLRSLHGAVGVAIDVLTMLDPVLRTWRGEDAAGAGAEALPAADAADVQDHPAGAAGAAPGADRHGNSGNPWQAGQETAGAIPASSQSASGATGACPECGTRFEPRRGGAKQIYCATACRKRAFARRRRANGDARQGAREGSPARSHTATSEGQAVPSHAPPAPPALAKRDGLEAEPGRPFERPFWEPWQCGENPAVTAILRPPPIGIEAIDQPAGT